MREIFIFILIAAIILPASMFLWLAVRAGRIKAKRDSFREMPEPEAEVSVRAAESLSALIRFKTVNTGTKKDLDTSSFRGLTAYLKTRYPQFHQRAALETVSEYSLLYRLPGAESGDPYLFSAHLDVAPATGLWEHGPFSGDIESGVVWGRGAVEGKSVAVCMLEAAERLLADGLTPPRDLFFAFTHDAESGGEEGARAIAEIFRQKQMQFSLVLGGGTPVTREILPAFRPAALVSVSERGRLILSLRVSSGGGRSALPPRHTAVSLLSEAICRVEFRERPPMSSEILAASLRILAPYFSFSKRLLIANFSIFSKQILKKLSGNRNFRPLIRTSQAVTSIAGTSGPESLPECAEAEVTFHTIHGDSPDAILSFAEKLCTGLGVTAEAVSLEHASRISDFRGEGFRAIKRALLLSYGVLPATPHVLPYMSDARAYEPFSTGVYRFSPFELTGDEQMRVHSTNERIRISSLGRAVQFYRELYMTPPKQASILE